MTIESPRVLCAAPSYLAKHGVPTALDDLPHHDTVGYANAPMSQIWRFEDDAGNARSVRVRCRAVANNGAAMTAASVAGLGLLVLPFFIVRPALQAGTLVRVELPERPVPDGVFAIYPPMRNNPPKVRAFIDHLADALPSDGL